MGERERVIEEQRKAAFVQIYDDKGNDYQIFKDGWDAAIAANLIRDEKPIIDMQKLREAIEAGDDAYKSSKIHGQAWWLDCIEGAITPVLREMGFEVKP